jgi:glyoxylate reductase
VPDRAFRALHPLRVLPVARALNERLIGGAALDGYEREPEVVAALLTPQDVVLVRHPGSATRETRAAMADPAVRKVLAVLTGQPSITSL